MKINMFCLNFNPIICNNSLLSHYVTTNTTSFRTTFYIVNNVLKSHLFKAMATNQIKHYLKNGVIYSVADIRTITCKQIDDQ